jgi:hypothetical protein
MTEYDERLSSVAGPDSASISIPTAPNCKEAPAGAAETNEAGRVIMSLLQRAATMVKDDCALAMDLAHKLASELRATEARAREAEATAAHFRDRATQAEAWLVRIRDQVEQTFFDKRGDERRQRALESSSIYAPPYIRESRPKGDKNGKE